MIKKVEEFCAVDTQVVSNHIMNELRSEVYDLVSKYGHKLKEVVIYTNVMGKIYKVHISEVEE